MITTCRACSVCHMLKQEVSFGFCMNRESLHVDALVVYLFRDSIVKQVETKLSGGVEANNDTFILTAASIYLHRQVMWT